MAGVTLRNAGNAAIVLKGIGVRDMGNVLHALSTGRIRDAGGTLRLFFTSMVASISPAEIKKTSGAIFAGAARHFTTLPATINVEGGVPPYTFAWTRVAGDAGMTANTPAAQTTFFEGDVVAPAHVNSTFEGKVTDAAGAVFTAQIVVDYRLELPV